MCQFVETIRIFQGNPFNLERHEQRLNHTIRLFRSSAPWINIRDYLQDIPKEDNILKCRMVYHPGGIEKVEYAVYHRKMVKSLKLIYDDDIDYHLKSTDRTELDRLKELQEYCDDILIIKKGFVTDTSYTNVCFQDKNGWWTPATPLLEGTMRQKLLEEDKIKECEIRPEDIQRFHKISLINAMIDLDSLSFSIDQIHP